jgi:hypothetical protein
VSRPGFRKIRNGAPDRRIEFIKTDRATGSDCIHIDRNIGRPVVSKRERSQSHQVCKRVLGDKLQVRVTIVTSQITFIGHISPPWSECVQSGDPMEWVNEGRRN